MQEQVSVLTSLFTTLITTSATLIGLVFIVYTFTMQPRNKSRADRKEQRKESYIMFTTLFNLLVPMFLCLLFLCLFSFNLFNFKENARFLMMEDLWIYYAGFIILCIVLVNTLLVIRLRRTYKLVSAMGILIGLAAVILPVVNFICYGLNELNVAFLTLYIIFMLVIAVIQIWCYLDIRHHYRQKEEEQSA